MAEEVKEEVKQEEQGFTDNYDKFSEFDQKPDYTKGGYADEEEEVNNLDFESKPEDETKKEEQQEEQQEPFSKISYGGLDYNFNSKEQLESMAQRGLQLSEQERRLSNYSQIIDMAERNPALGNALTNIIQQYMQTGQVVPLNTPVPQTTVQEDPNKEPEQGDDEDYDDYEKRLAQWRDNRINNMVDQKVREILAYNQQAAEQAAITKQNRDIVNYCYGDPDREEVIARMTNDNWCAPQIRAVADRDGIMFMRVYDDIKRGMGKPPFYGAPSLAPQSQQQPTQQVQRQPQKSAPFSERANNIAQAKNNNDKQELPDFKKMSDAEFTAFKDNLKLRNFN